MTLKKMVTSSMGMKVAPGGGLFADVPLPLGLTKDTEEGYLLFRSVKTALIAPCPPQGDKVYEVLVETESGLESSMWLEIPERCCQDLGLQDQASPLMEIQFQLERRDFCFYHEAVDRLQDPSLVLPDLAKCRVPTDKQLLSWGNTKQQMAASYIIGSVPENNLVAPLLIYGPFGTGKTYTIAKTTLEVIKQKGSRVLICTHNNSTADLYIREHFHPHVLLGHPEAIPLRVKYQLSPINRTDEITLQYCALAEDNLSFSTPQRGKLDQHQIIVTTAATSRDLNVPRGYFTHIFLDETAQMLESEALVPLTLADHRTRILMAGDHMQETPRLFSQALASCHEELTLLTRLFSYYQCRDCVAANGARIIFHQNYRSVPAIISFISRCFYVGRDDAIEACAGGAESPKDRYALALFHVRGPSTKDGNSWVNQSEVLQVLEVVKDVLQHWPESWGPVKRDKICVVSQGSQVQLIRQELRKIGHRDITVTSYDNIIGCEYHVIILSAVRSLESLPSTSPMSSNCSLEVFCNPRVLNTILTRARSQIIVVGDMVALCSFGGCSRIWRRYVRECVEKGTASPPDLSVEEIRQVVYSQHFWTEQEENDEDLEDSDSWSSDPDINSEDLILQELLERGTKAFVTVSEEGILEISSGGHAESREGKYKIFPTHQLEQYLLKQPNMYKKCQLIKDSFDSGCAVTLHEIPPKRIHIKGRLNLGMAFSGDQVVVKLRDTNSQEGKVVGVLNPGKNVRRYVCYMEPHDKSIMVPIDKSVTKIYCHHFKEKPGFVPIRSFKNGRVKNIGFAKLTQEMKQDQLFLVQVIKWDQGFYYPLGIVIRILPKISTEKLGLQVLDLEYGVAASREYPEKASREAEELSSNIPFTDERLDCRDILTFTIDPLNAKDLDDAISVRDLQDHYEIGIHITDLTQYVCPGSELDTEARSRGVTFYCPKSDPVQMLPFRLSSDLCSLKSKCDRRAVSLFVLVQKSTDQMVEGQFCRTLIRSDRQLSYEEANSILNAQQGCALAFNSVEDCLGVAWHFSKVHCRCRLQDAAIYKQPDEHCSTGARSAQRMIEELMIMYNNWVAEYLCEKESLNHVVPLRCQAHPSIEKLEMVRDKIKHLLPLSSYLSHHLLDDPAHGYPSHDLKITILSSIWEQLQSAAQKEDFIRVMDLLSTDDLHPELCDAALKFRKSLGRSYLKRSTSPGPNEHYSLQLCAYTWASSPIRRYLDIVVQRLLHSSLTNKEPKMDAQDIDMLCHEFEMQVHQESVYEKKSHALCLALSFQNQVQKKMSVVVSAEPHSNGLQVFFPLNGDSLSSPLDILYSMLQPSAQPEETVGGTQLSWRRRVYSHHFFRDLPALRFYQEDIVAFSGKAWQDALSALRQSKPEEVLSILKKGIEKVDAENTTQRSKCGHYVELTLDLRPGKSFFIQLCTTLKRGLPTASPQLFFPSPAIQLCLEHTDRPIECFSKLANRGPLTIYKNEAEYVRLWLPLCDMEAVVSAVGEGGGVLLRDVPVRWQNKDTNLQSVGMKGSFKLSGNLINECDLDMDFRHCYLCIRMEDLHTNSSPGELDSQTYTWVAHGLTDKVSEKKTDSDKEDCTVTFHIHQATMKHAPEEAFKSAALFTLEIIPKLLPDIRKEFAVKLLKSASELTKNIALGKRIPDAVINRKFKSQNSFNIPCYRGLNPSQTKAVKAAVTQPFTVIQGPPGTGKTVVGVHIVHWFHHINEELNLQVEEEKEEEEKDKSVEQNEEECSRRRVMMYCGPSNKSVDVVAEMLLPLRDKLRPLRVYSEQIELTEFPYPGSSLRMSGYLREGRPNPNLRSITLHHRIRQPSNRHHHAILAMDRRIQNKENITPEEIKEYKNIVYKARLVELKCHDVVLCTCVAASSKSLTKLRVSQVIVDESAMCTEPEVLVPLVNHKRLDSVVLIGDHRQLRPVILNNMCRLLKMDHSLFERYQQRALMLDTQYRMHKAICAFPSEEFYEGLLITSDQLQLRPSLFYQTNKICPIVFGEVMGKEKSLNVTTEEGNINSKANTEEAEEAIRLARCLVQESVQPSDIAILSPYNAQVTLITKKLQEQNLSGVTVCTIMKSQGSEWRYVIFSTVRTMPEHEVDKRPTISWTRRHLGFLSDRNQINVALTRPKEGLCVLGNSSLLECSPLWRRLIQHYRRSGSLVCSTEINNPRSRRR